MSPDGLGLIDFVLKRYHDTEVGYGIVYLTIQLLTSSGPLDQNEKSGSSHKKVILRNFDWNSWILRR